MASGPRLAETSHWVARDRYAVLLAVDSGAGAGAGAGCGALYAVATALDWPGSERPTAFVRIEAVTHPDGTPAHRTRAIRCWADRCLELVEVEERREERTRPK